MDEATQDALMTQLLGRLLSESLNAEGVDAPMAITTLVAATVAHARHTLLTRDQFVELCGDGWDRAGACSEFSIAKFRELGLIKPPADPETWTETWKEAQ